MNIFGHHGLLGGVAHAFGVDKLINSATHLFDALKNVVTKADFGGLLKAIETAAVTELGQLPAQLLRSNPFFALAQQASGVDLFAKLLAGMQKHGANGSVFTGPLLGFLHKNLPAIDLGGNGINSVARGLAALFRPSE